MRQTLSAEQLPEDDVDRSLRPRRLEDFIGQEALKDQLAVSIAAASSRDEALDHVLLAGPPGLGKTSLAQIVAAELDVPFVQTAGPALERKGDVAAFLTALEPRSVFFVDEIHRLPRALEETFYPAMEDRCLPITVGQGAGARVVTGSTTTTRASSRASCGAPRACLASRSRMGARWPSPHARAAPRASPTAC
jgi:Holliday junction DNA helicase RuvB